MRRGRTANPDFVAIREVAQRARAAAQSRHMAPRKTRVEALRGLRALMQENKTALYRVLHADLGKHPVESALTEIERIIWEIDHALLHLADWVEPEPVRVPLKLQPASAKVVPQPKGAVLVISPWNYPLALSLIPVVNAMAGGNSVVLKPSEYSVHTTSLLAELVPQYLDPRVLAVVTGDAAVGQELLTYRWDHVFFTGSATVGKKVYLAAAEHLTPVTLELGGKCPAVVTSGNAVTIARRLVYGKFTNAGQTCVAPDYVLAAGDDAYAALLEQLPAAITDFYGKNAAKSNDYGRIINQQHFERLRGYLTEGRVLHGGRTKSSDRFIEPTVLVDVPDSSPVWEEEIFGPILPVKKVDSFAAALAYLKERPEPLAAYLFSDQHRQQRSFEEQIRAGAIVHNVAIAHLSVQELPFGGAGASGFGAYQGKTGFDTFTQARPVFSKPLGMDTMRLAYPPFTWGKRRIVKNWLG